MRFACSRLNRPKEPNNGAGLVAGSIVRDESHNEKSLRVGGLIDGSLQQQDRKLASLIVR